MRPYALLLTALIPRADSAIAGDWRVIQLHPDGALASEAFDVGQAKIVGSILYTPSTTYPALRDADSGTLTDLLPGGLYYGVVYGTDGHQQVGFCSGGSPVSSYTPLWTGTADSFIDLFPGAPYRSGGTAHGVCSGQQFGMVVPPSDPQHAALWHGTPISFVDLHPSGAQWSEALATDGVLQGGRAYRLPGTAEIHAVLWHGTAESWVDMNPLGSRESRIRGMADGVQVGWGLFFTQTRACLWHGTPESYQDMHPTDDPPGSTSRLYDTTGRYHAGYVEYTGWAEATVWLSGDPDDFVNLHHLLGLDYYASAAYGISEHEGKLYVAGSSARAGQRERATLWIGRIPDTDRPPRRPPTATPGQQTKPTTASPLIP